MGAMRAGFFAGGLSWLCFGLCFGLRRLLHRSPKKSEGVRFDRALIVTYPCKRLTCRNRRATVPTDPMVMLPAHLGVMSRNPFAGRRREPRYHCPPATSARVTRADGSPVIMAWVLDLSSRGIGLLLPEELAP